jgi:hypothetical protein
MAIKFANLAVILATKFFPFLTQLYLLFQKLECFVVGNLLSWKPSTDASTKFDDTISSST